MVREWKCFKNIQEGDRRICLLCDGGIHVKKTMDANGVSSFEFHALHSGGVLENEMCDVKRRHIALLPLFLRSLGLRSVQSEQGILHTHHISDEKVLAFFYNVHRGGNQHRHGFEFMCWSEENQGRGRCFCSGGHDRPKQHLRFETRENWRAGDNNGRYETYTWIIEPCDGSCQPRVMKPLSHRDRRELRRIREPYEKYWFYNPRYTQKNT